MVENLQGIGYLYHLSEPFHGSYHVFISVHHRLVYPCNARGEILTVVPWLAPEADSIPEIFQDFGYVIAT